jgi:hypothetical protein
VLRLNKNASLLLMYTGLRILSLYLTFMEQSSDPYWYQDVK